ncbi:hypothetical protein B0T16DRAFT_407181 [Cercophora newfieldiana]|uniref:Uncharacterized protein n=1 Tax=Cercophora newfieldiana TaxID=92897 RepID=A0AA39YI02_9PEZI|nr:hypothetical protein B0T16DRAFT_407181 [Cercophora newfieldiana]
MRDAPSQQQQQQRPHPDQQAAGGRLRPFSMPRFPFGSLSSGNGNGNGSGNGSGNGGFRFGGIAVEGDRVSIGDRFVADRNGVRIGGIVADTNGISVNGQPMFRGCPPGGMRGCHPGFGHHHGSWAGRGFGGGFGGPGFGGGPPWGRGQFSDWVQARGGGPPGFGCGPRGRGRGRGRRGGGDDEGRGFGRGRGRHHNHNHHGEQNRSRDSSVSSTSSSSSSDSDSSVGSLPDHDRLMEPQLSVAKEYLLAWLSQPDQPITRQKMKEAKQRINEAREAPVADAESNPTPPAVDLKALRKEYKAMHKEWKSLKKEQNRSRKQLRRERRQKRRDEKREWRNTKREVRRAERELRRGGGGPPQGFPFDGSAPFPSMPAMPTMPTVGSFGGGRRGPPGPPWSPMGLGQLFGGWGGQNQSEGQTQGTTQVRDADPSTTPGAWPNDDHGIDRQHRPSQAKYKAAADLEAQVVAKESELIRVHEAIVLEEEEKRNTGRGGGDHKMQTDAETKVHRLECEIEALARSMAQLRTEADEEFARELADEERRGGW